jgi:hypothetical protein
MRVLSEAGLRKEPERSEGEFVYSVTAGTKGFEGKKQGAAVTSRKGKMPLVERTLLTCGYWYMYLLCREWNRKHRRGYSIR